MIAYAKREELILCDKHVIERLDELHVPHFEILADPSTQRCVCFGRPDVVYDLPFFAQQS